MPTGFWLYAPCLQVDIHILFIFSVYFTANGKQYMEWNKIWLEIIVAFVEKARYFV